MTEDVIKIVNEWEASEFFPKPPKYNFLLLMSESNINNITAAVQANPPKSVADMVGIINGLTEKNLLQYERYAQPAAQPKDEMPYADVKELSGFQYVEDFDNREKAAAFLRNAATAAKGNKEVYDQLSRQFAERHLWLRQKGIRRPVVEAAPQNRVQRTPADLLTLEQARNAIERYRDSKGGATTIARKKILVELYDAAVAKGQYADDVLAAVKQRIDGWTSTSIK